MPRSMTTHVSGNCHTRVMPHLSLGRGQIVYVTMSAGIPQLYKILQEHLNVADGTSLLEDFLDAHTLTHTG